jgi:hypothetical protein
VHNWSTFGAQTNHGQTRIHKTHHGPELGKATTFPLIVFSMPGHGANTRMSFFLGVATLALGLQLKQGLVKVRAHFGSWSPNGLPTFQRIIVRVKTH